MRDPALVKSNDWSTARELLQPPTAPPAAVPVLGHAPADQRITHLVNYVRNAQEGNRNNALHWAANRALDNGSTDLGALVAAAVEAGLPGGRPHCGVGSAPARQRWSTAPFSGHAASHARSL